MASVPSPTRSTLVSNAVSGITGSSAIHQALGLGRSMLGKGTSFAKRKLNTSKSKKLKSLSQAMRENLAGQKYDARQIESLKTAKVKHEAKMNRDTHSAKLREQGYQAKEAAKMPGIFQKVQIQKSKEAAAKHKKGSAMYRAKKKELQLDAKKEKDVKQLGSYTYKTPLDRKLVTKKEGERLKKEKNNEEETVMNMKTGKKVKVPKEAAGFQDLMSEIPRKMIIQ